MLEDLLQREDVKSFIEEIKTNDKYFQKNHEFSSQKDYFLSFELALFIFYDALLKFQIIIDDIDYFQEYLEQIEKLYRKLDDFENIRIGIHNLLCKLVFAKLGLHDYYSKEDRRELLTYIYHKYIEEGYLVHGFSGYYASSLQRDGFVPEEYDSFYPQYEVIENIFQKYHVSSVLSKDFSSKKVAFTDNYVMGCYYSMYAPMFYYEFLMNPKFGKKVPKDLSFGTLIGPVRKYMNNAMFRDSDRRYVLDFLKKQWILLHSSKRDIHLLLVKRKDLIIKEVSLRDYLSDEHDVFEVVDRILSPKYSVVSCERAFTKDEIIVVALDSHRKEKRDKKSIDLSLEEEYSNKEREVGQEFLNVYGNVSMLLILGALFISLGVIITILMIIGG